ncbi:MAG: radical SAM protein [Dehalococcoidia bacterium]|jgi:putative pyruvate formate lyase activating enzyme|nr:radical SAM protein [Dehalococcoidia bacterium]
MSNGSLNDRMMPDCTSPSYLRLYKSGELQRRRDSLLAHLSSCDICPRECRVDRTAGQRGFCHSPRSIIVASACDHHGEEPVISGSRGSGAIFFANCNLRCVYCQNYQISQAADAFAGREEGAEALADTMLQLQDVLRCHNVNLVSPTHFVPQILEALCLAVERGFRLPLVYNTNAYDSSDVLRLLDGVVDIYLPDIKYASERVAARLSGAVDYVRAAREAITEMHRQVGAEVVLDREGTARRGLLIRHLVLPGGLAGSRESLSWVARDVSPHVTLSLMAQYYPTHHALHMPLLSRRITAQEYLDAVTIAQDLGCDHILAQQPGAAAFYRPDFDAAHHPFAPGDG